MGYQSVESIIDHSAHIYTGARIQRSRLGAHVIVGDFSRVDFSHLAYRVRIDRNNHLYHVHIGRHTYTGMNTVLMHATVGSFCSIAWNVSIGGANHDYTRVAQHSFLYNDCDYLRPNGTEIPYDRFCESLTIGSDVWVATGAVIRRGVTIGDGAVIGANAVVTRDVPPYMIVAGSPARVIKPRFDDEIVEILLTLKWWEWNEKKIYAHFEALSSHPDIGRLRELMA